MKKALKMFIALGLAILILMSSITYANAFFLFPSYVVGVFDKTEAKVGDIVTAQILVINVPRYCSWQFNLKYDPQMLQPVDPQTGYPYPERVYSFPYSNVFQRTVLNDVAYSPMEVGVFNYQNGNINFGGGYLDINSYKLSGNVLSSGCVGKISFRVLKQGSTLINFENDINRMPGSVNGTYVFNCDSVDPLKGYFVLSGMQLTATY